ncbi:hypothetical protein [Maridesulfovibrio zosterae]|uniref:hypothetical protein n=1 Tax=Maridesulfovibrio zosterae TaxID=82171 RepID=UPI0003FBDAFB|nr:hypothetical protein [Maridesulfovibrio zosterae]
MFENLTTYDPYDVWAMPLFGKLKMDYNNGKLTSRPLLVMCYLADFLFPVLTRKALGCPRTISPHVLALHCLSKNGQFTSNECEDVLHLFEQMNVLERGCAWGLPFRWYSKHAVYSDKIPYITHTPYVMEALLQLTCDDTVSEKAEGMFLKTWSFMESLRVMFSDGQRLALSYSSEEEVRIVNNAQTYAAYAYAMHYAYGDPDHASRAEDRCRQLAAWVLSQQRDDGSWLYYADSKSGNFLDCFHSCFIIKNLSKAAELVPSMKTVLGDSLERAINFLDDYFLDKDKLLCRRFVNKVRRDLYRWDIYDQAEYLGILVDQGRVKEAVLFRESVSCKFSDGKNWWCRIDPLGRRWGKNFLRWGIMPFQYQSKRLDNLCKDVR